MFDYGGEKGNDKVITLANEKMITCYLVKCFFTFQPAKFTDTKL